MKTYLLTLIKTPAPYNDDIAPIYWEGLNQAVVFAENEQQARQLILDSDWIRKGITKYPNIGTPLDERPAWSSSEYVTCVELIPNGDARIVCVNYEQQ